MEEIIIRRDFSFENARVATLKLPSNTARIYFFGSPVRIKNKSSIAYAVTLAIGKKKHIINWITGEKRTELQNLPTYGSYGIQVLIWAKKVIEKFIEENLGEGQIIYVGGADKKRQRVYEKSLKRMGFEIKTLKIFDYGYEGEEETWRGLVYIKPKEE